MAVDIDDVNRSPTIGKPLPAIANNTLQRHAMAWLVREIPTCDIDIPCPKQHMQITRPLRRPE